MSHGGPDYGVSAGARTTYRWADLDELAVRLGSIVGFDRRGDVLYLDSFEDGYHRWFASAVGTGGLVSLSRAHARSGVYSLRLVTGSDSFRSAQAQRIWSYPVISAFGLEASFTLATNLQEIDMSIIVYTGALAWQVYGRYLHATHEWQVYVAPGNWVTIVTLTNPMVSPYSYHTFKLVGDPASGHYVRAILDAQTIDIHTLSMTSPVSAVEPQLYVQLKAISVVVNTATVYLDDVIVTQNEPP
jgi:hypothetical protein